MELVKPSEGYVPPPIEMVRVRLSNIAAHDRHGWGEMAKAA
jgi:hypothetical protein